MLKRDTVFSPCKKYRYTLWREFAGDLFFSGTNRQREGFLQVIGLNPSTATEVIDDRTIAKLKKYAAAWGFPAYCMTNLFAYRSPYPEVMMAEDEPIGQDNNEWLSVIAGQAEMILCAWGTGGDYKARGEKVLTLLKNLGHGHKLYYLRLTKAKHPEHPLYLPGNLVPVPFQQ